MTSQAALIALFPVACPHCTRGYQLELDVVKLARLKRIAVCGQCGEHFSVSVRIDKGAKPPAARSGATSAANGNGGARAPDMAAALAEAKTDPNMQPPKFDWDGDGAGETAASGRPLTDVERMATVPNRRIDLDASSSTSAQEPAPGPHEEAADDASSGKQRTLGGVGAPPARVGPGVDTHIIVEVDSVGDSKKPRKRQRSLYRPEHLVTKPGLGIPFALRAASADDQTSKAEGTR